MAMRPNWSKMFKGNKVDSQKRVDKKNNDLNGYVDAKKKIDALFNKDDGLDSLIRDISEETARRSKIFDDELAEREAMRTEMLDDDIDGDEVDIEKLDEMCRDDAEEA